MPARAVARAISAVLPFADSATLSPKPSRGPDRGSRGPCWRQRKPERLKIHTLPLKPPPAGPSSSVPPFADSDAA